MGRGRMRMSQMEHPASATHRRFSLHRFPWRPHLIAPFAFPLLACFSNLPAASIVAQWDFDDVGNASTSVASIGGFVGDFQATTKRTATGEGVSGAPDDYALDVGGMTARGNDFLAALNGHLQARSLSVTFWLQPTGALQGYGFFGNPPFGYVANEFSNGQVSYWYSTPIEGSMGTPTSDWQLMSFVDQNGLLQIYRDSTLVASGVRPGVPGFQPNLTEFYIATAVQIPPGNTAVNLTGRIDDFTVWNGPLTAAEVAALAVKPIPEPSASALLWVIGVLGASRWRRRV
jgi:hypothetical protein